MDTHRKYNHDEEGHSPDRKRARGEAACKAVRDINKQGESVGTTVRDVNKYGEAACKAIRESKRNNERGNVLFIILIAIALLASLSYAITHSSRGGDTFNSERTGLAADEIIAYGNTLSTAVGQLRLRGCTTSQISFENNIATIYTNGSAPSDNSCHIFHPDGGGMTYQNTNSSSLIASGTGIYFDGSMEIEDIGTTCAATACSDLVFYVRDLKENICIEINNKLSITNPSGVPPLDDGTDFDPFIGTYSYDLSLGDTVGSAAITGAKSACLQENGGSTYNFYRVLIAR